MTEIYLMQTGFTYSSFRLFIKSKEIMQKFKKTGDSQYIYQKGIDKACFQNDMASGHFKDFSFSIRFFFHEHSRFTGQQGKGKCICLTHLYYFHPLHRHLEISRVITAESSPLHIASSRTRTGNSFFIN